MWHSKMLLMHLFHETTVSLSYISQLSGDQTSYKPVSKPITELNPSIIHLRHAAISLKPGMVQRVCTGRDWEVGVGRGLALNFKGVFSREEEGNTKNLLMAFLKYWGFNMLIRVLL